MSRLARRLLVLVFALCAAAPAAFAQAPRSYSQPELDQMLAPVALYPDTLLSQVLMAATYPDEVAEAAAWTRAYPGLPGDDAVRAVENQDWDPSVKSLVAFPQILMRMEENIDWTRNLGEAFLAQEAQVMDTVQQLRWRAQAAGNLQSDEQLRVEQQGQTIVLQPASPQLVYVPYYDPFIVYGPWWWPSYRPVAWAPWAGYVRGHRPGYASFWWGRPVGVSASFFFGNFNWRERRVRVVHNHYHRPHATDRERWQHNPQRRRMERQAGEQRFAPPVQRQAPARVQPQAPASVQRQAPAPVQLQAPARVQAQPAVVAPMQPRFLPPQQRMEREQPRMQRGESPPAVAQPRASAEVRIQQPAPPPAAAPQQRIERQERREVRHEHRGERARAGGDRR